MLARSSQSCSAVTGQLSGCDRATRMGCPSGSAFGVRNRDDNAFIGKPQVLVIEGHQLAAPQRPGKPHQQQPAFRSILPAELENCRSSSRESGSLPCWAVPFARWMPATTVRTSFSLGGRSVSGELVRLGDGGEAAFDPC